MLTGSATITIDDTINGNINLPARGYAGKSFDGSIFIDGGGVATPRFPFTSTEVTASATESATITLNAEWETAANWNNGRCVFESEIDKSCEAVYSLVYDDDALANASITIYPADVFVFIDGPSTLHIYGAGKQLRIEFVIDGEPPSNGEKPTVSASVDGDAVTISDYLEMADGTAIDFTTGWSNGVWSGQVRAKSSASDALIKLVASYTSGNETYSDTLCLSIVEEMTGSVTFSTNRTAPNAQFGVTLNVESLDGEALTRLPSGGGVTVAHGAESGGATMLVNGAAPVFTFVNGTCTLTGCTVDAECIYDVKMTFADGVIVGGSISITNALASVANLLEAINERRLAKGDSALDTSATYTLSQLKSYAEDAISGFVNGAFNEDTGLYPTFAASGTIDNVPESQDEYDEWIGAAYGIVCSAVEKEGSFEEDKIKYVVGGNVHWESYIEDGNWEPPLASVKSGLEAEARSEYHEASVSDSVSASLYAGKYYVDYNYGTDWPYGGGNYKFYRPECTCQVCRARCTTTYNQVSRTVSFVAKDSSGKGYREEYSQYFTRVSLGVRLPPLGKYGFVLNEVFAPSGQNFGYTEYSGKPEFYMAPKWGCYDYAHDEHTAYYLYGFTYLLSKCYVTYGFKHR